MLKRSGLNRNLAVLSVTIFVNLFLRFMWYPLLPLHLRALGANEWEIGVSFTLIGIAQTLFSIFGGALADRYGRKWIIALPTFLMGPLYVAAALTTSWSVVVGMLASAFALGALLWPAFVALVAESAEEERVARAYSFTEAAVLTGAIAGPVVGAGLLAVLDIPTMILWSGIGLILTALLRVWGLREPSRRKVGSALPKLRAAIVTNVRWFIAMGSCITIAFSMSFGPYFAILARDAWRNSEPEINLLFAAGNVAALIGIVLGRLSDRWGARRVLMFAALGYGIGTIVWGLAPTWQGGLLPLLIAFGFSEAMIIAQQTLQAEITSPETRSPVIGIIATTTGFVGGLGPTLGAWLITLGGNSMPFVAAGATGLIAMIAVTQVAGLKSQVTGQATSLKSQVTGQGSPET